MRFVCQSVSLSTLFIVYYQTQFGGELVNLGQAGSVLYFRSLPNTHLMSLSVCQL